MATRASDRERARASDPGASADELRALAARCPDEVLANPALDLLSLADPAAWLEIGGRARAAHDERALARALLTAHAAALRVFAAVTLRDAVASWSRLRPTQAAHDAPPLARALDARAAPGSAALDDPGARSLAGRIGDRGKRQRDALTAGIGQASYVLFERPTRERLEGAARAAAELEATFAEHDAHDAPSRASARADVRAAQLLRLANLVDTTPTRIELETTPGGQLPLRFTR